VLGTLAYDLLIGRTLVQANPEQVPTSGMDPSHLEEDANALVRK
jgi:hypothetical protein